jgi:hypothetical protein
VSRGIALSFLGPRHSRWGGGQPHAPAASTSGKDPGAHFTGGWVGPKAGLDGRKISCPPEFDPAFVQYTYLNAYVLYSNADSSIVQCKHFWPVEFSNGRLGASH